MTVLNLVSLYLISRIISDFIFFDEKNLNASWKVVSVVIRTNEE